VGRAASKVSYGFDVLPKLMAKDMRVLIEKTRGPVENAMQRIKLG